ncbi:MAG: response regulator [Pseudomonadota bacterium]
MGKNTDGDDNAAQEIVFVDDMPQLLAIAEGMLSKLGHPVRCFANPLDALAYIGKATSEIGLLITDQSMPAMTGLELIGAVRELPCELPSVLSTSVPEPAAVDDYLARGVNAILPKPFTMSELEAVVRSQFEPDMAYAQSQPSGC